MKKTKKEKYAVFTEDIMYDESPVTIWRKGQKYKVLKENENFYTLEQNVIDGSKKENHMFGIATNLEGKSYDIIEKEIS